MSEISYGCISYPAFEPDHTWVRKMLLFVDEIYRIVPSGEEIHDSEDLKRLIDVTDGAVKICEPSPYVDISESAAENFASALDQSNFLKIANAKKFEFTFRGSSTEVANWEFLHVGKIGPRVRAELQLRNMIGPPFASDTGNRGWELVPRGVGALVVGMLADKAAEERGLDAITDHPLAFALNSLNQCCSESSPRIDGIIASTVASVLIPKNIGRLPLTEYAELRKAHADARVEYARMVRELRATQRISAKLDARVFKERLENITRHLGQEMARFRTSREAAKFNDWIPFSIASLTPIAAALSIGPIPTAVTGVFSFGVYAIGKLTKRTERFSYPKVMETLCSLEDTAAAAAIRRLGII